MRRPGVRAADHEHAAHQRVQAVSKGEVHGDGREDRDRGRCECAERCEYGGHEEEYPWDQSHLAAHETHARRHQKLDRAVPSCDGEEIGDTDDGHEQLDGETLEDLIFCEAERCGTHKEGGDEGEDAEIDRQYGAHDEHDEQGAQGDHFSRHHCPHEAEVEQGLAVGRRGSGGGRAGVGDEDRGVTEQAGGALHRDTTGAVRGRVRAGDPDHACRGAHAQGRAAGGRGRGEDD